MANEIEIAEGQVWGRKIGETTGIGRVRSVDSRGVSCRVLADPPHDYMFKILKGDMQLRPTKRKGFFYVLLRLSGEPFDPAQIGEYFEASEGRFYR